MNSVSLFWCSLLHLILVCQEHYKSVQTWICQGLIFSKLNIHYIMLRKIYIHGNYADFYDQSSDFIQSSDLIPLKWLIMFSVFGESQNTHLHFWEFVYSIQILHIPFSIIILLYNCLKRRLFCNRSGLLTMLVWKKEETV